MPAQVPRILNPVVLVLDQLPKLCRDPQVAAYVQAAFGGVEACRKAILLDFFRHAFDGSGAGGAARGWSAGGGGSGRWACPCSCKAASVLQCPALLPGFGLLLLASRAAGASL